MKFSPLWMMALTAGLLASCAAPSEDTEAGSGAQTTAKPAPLQSLVGKLLRFDASLSLALEEKTPTFAGVTLHADGGPLLSLPIFRLPGGAGDYSLAVKGSAGRVSEIPVKVPSNVVTNATPRFMLYRIANDQAQQLLAPNDVGMFETLSVVGDTIQWRAKLVDGTVEKGTFPAPGMQSGDEQYTIVVIPRNVEQGSLLGTHFFEIGVSCKVAGCIADPFDSMPPPVLPGAR